MGVCRRGDLAAGVLVPITGKYDESLNMIHST
jgi:hypothetical protein